MIKSKSQVYVAVILATIIIGMFIKSSKPWVSGPVCGVLLFLIMMSFKYGVFDTEGIRVGWVFLFKRKFISKENIEAYSFNSGFLYVSPSITFFFKEQNRRKKMALDIHINRQEQLDQLFQSWGARKLKEGENLATGKISE